MKRCTCILLVIVILAVSLTFTACDQGTIKVNSTLSIDKDFSGTRTITIVFPLKVKIDDISATLVDTSPKDIDGVSFEYLGVEEAGYYFELLINFNSKKDYSDKVSAIIGREANIYLSTPKTVLANGIRMKEDFDSGSLIPWVKRIVKDNPQISSLSYSYDKNTVRVEDNVYNTGTTTNIIERTGEEINGIEIDTVNKKNDTYDRTITFSIPNTTYEKLEQKLKVYFETNTMPVVKYYGWSDKGESKEYKVIYEDLSLEELKEYTSMILSCDDTHAFYGDKDNASTPLSEGYTFEESFDTFSFIGKDNKPIKIVYHYSLPTETIHGEGAIKLSGDWKQNGSWIEGVYSTSIEDDILSIRIPDGKQYNVKEINFTLESISDNNFVRTTDFVYSKDDLEGLSYAIEYFRNKKAIVDDLSNDINNVCRVTCKGTAGEITDSLIKLFGSGNYMSYNVNSKAFSLSRKTNMIDYVNIGYMLNETNSNVPMSYKVVSSGEENIISLSCDSEKAYKTGDNALEVSVLKGVGTVEYKGVISNTGFIVLYIVIAIILILLALFVIVFMNKRKLKVIRNEFVKSNQDFDYDDEIEDEIETDISQTTIFKISDLVQQKDKENKNE